MGNYEGPRTMHPEEYDELMDLAEGAYGFTKQHFFNYYPLGSKRKNIIPGNYFVIKEDGKLVSCVGLVPLEAIVDGSRIKVGGIAGVATHPDYKGRGYMGKLLNYTTEEMKEREIPLSVLGGDTQRYRHFGWETSGRKVLFHLNRRSLEEVNIGKDFTWRSYNEKKDLERIIEIYEKEPLRIKHSREDFERMLERTQIQRSG